MMGKSLDFSFFWEDHPPTSPDDMTIDELFDCPNCEEYSLKNGECPICGYELVLMAGRVEYRRQWLKDHPGEQ